MRDHPIFDDIQQGELTAAERRVWANPAVLDERGGNRRLTPIIYAIATDNPALAAVLLDHHRRCRSPHNIDTRDSVGLTALHWACARGPPWWRRWSRWAPTPRRSAPAGGRP